MKPPLLSIMVHPMKSTVLSHPRNATPRLVLQKKWQPAAVRGGRRQQQASPWPSFQLWKNRCMHSLGRY